MKSFICIKHQQTVTHFLYSSMNAKYEMNQIKPQFYVDVNMYSSSLVYALLYFIAALCLWNAILLLFNCVFSAVIKRPSQRTIHSISVKTHRFWMLLTCAPLGFVQSIWKKSKKNRIHNVLCQLLAAFDILFFSEFLRKHTCVRLDCCHAGIISKFFNGKAR